MDNWLYQCYIHDGSHDEKAKVKSDIWREFVILAITAVCAQLIYVELFVHCSSEP